MSRKKSEKDNRIWRLSSDVVITPVVEMPEDVVKELIKNNKDPKNYFAIERKRSRSKAKIVNRDVVDVLRAFGEEGATYEGVLNQFLKLKKLKRRQLHPEMLKMVRTFIGANFLVEGKKKKNTSEAIEPSIKNGVEWYSYEILENVQVLIDTEIYKIRHIPSGVLRALKITRDTFPRRSLRKKIFEGLRREFRVIQKIKHPYIVKVHDYGIRDGRMYGVMDWIEGKTVYDYAYSDDSAPDDFLLLRLSIECLEALHAVHSAGYLHGDVHTRNFLVRNGHVCLIDFGLARPIRVTEKDIGKYTEGGVINFMPPEYVSHTFEGKKGFWGSVAGEVYSCGVIIFSLFTKKYPYKWALYKKDFMKNILNDPLTSFEECEREPWPELENILRKSMAKKPEDRFSSAAEFAEELKALMINKFDKQKAKSVG